MPTDEPDNTDQRVGRVVSEMVAGQGAIDEDALSQEAIELLLAAAHATGNREGVIVLRNSNVGLSIFPGNEQCPYQLADRRDQAKYKAALEELLSKGLIEYTSDSIREVTNSGYLRSDEIASAQGQPD